MEENSKLDEVFRNAESLNPDDRLRLIARLWASLPKDYWAAPIDRERAEVEAMLCTGDTAGMSTLPQRIARHISGASPDGELPKIYSAPRRFDLSTIFVVTLAYSILFAGLNSLDALPVVSAITGAFISIVGIAQPLLFGGRNPRLASIVVGAVAMVPITIAGATAMPRAMPVDWWIIVIPVCAAMGAFLGYLAGAMVGGVFLVADVVRRLHARRRPTADLHEPALIDSDATERGAG